MLTPGNIFVFGDTERNDHDLIAIVDREPCKPEHYSTEIGYYGTEWQPGKTGASSRPMNVSFALFGEYINLAGAELKTVCALHKSSPLIYTTISPESLQYSAQSRPTTEQKSALRESIPGERIENHIDTVFANQDLLNRVGLIVYAGVADCGLDAGISHFDRHAERLGITSVHMPTLNTVKGVTQTCRTDALEPHKPLIKTIMDSYLDSRASTGLDMAA